MKKTLIAIVLAALSVPAASAEVTLLPQSRAQQYQTYALFNEIQSSLLLRNADRAWGSLGGSIALLEISHWASKPQLVAHGMASAAFHLNSGGNGLLTETIDARAGAHLEFILGPELRLAVGYTHQSGHISDNVPDPELIGPNIGNEIIWVRLVKDFGDQWRVGGTLRPTLLTDPPAQKFGMDEFAEWFPWGISSDPRHGSPYLAAGLEQYGVKRAELTGHVQAGVFFGNHNRPEHMQSFRIVTGYYNGVDPRLKYAQYKYRRSVFGYLGLEFDL